MSKTRTPLDKFAKLLKNPSHDLSVDVYNENKKTRETSVKKPNDGKMTLTKLANEMREGFNKVNNRLDGIDTRLDKLENRLDYIVKANKLKDLPNN